VNNRPWGAVAVLGAVVALTLAAGLVLLAADARGWQDTLREDDVLFQMAPARAHWAPDERAPDGFARRLLGVDDDIRLRRALRLFQLAHLPVTTFEGGQNAEILRVRAQIALAQIERNAADARDRAIAANLLGVLAFEEARNDPLNAASLLRRSAQEFRNAIALAPEGEDAKANLEILLRLSRPGAEQTRKQVGIFGAAHGVGAGASRAGRGY
jgi:hypothetical protein